MRVVIFSTKRVLQSLRRAPKNPAAHQLYTLRKPESIACVPGFVTILNNQKIASSIVQKLHFVDVVNLGKVSKSLQVALFEPQDRLHQREVMRVASCSQGLKSQCWTCGAQVCDVCQVPFDILIPSSAFLSSMLTSRFRSAKCLLGSSRCLLQHT